MGHTKRLTFADETQHLVNVIETARRMDMSEVRGIDGVLPPAVGFGSPVVRESATNDTGVAVQDRVEISELARSLSEDHDGIDAARLAKITEIRSAIRAGTYLTADKLDAAVQKAIDNL